MRDDTQKRGPAGTPNPATHATTDSVAAGTDRRPGEWPRAAAALRAKWQHEHSRRTTAFAAIREHLAEQPTPRSIRAVARLWCRDITHAADELAQARQDQEHDA